MALQRRDLPEERDIAPVEEAEVLEAEAEHRDPAHAEAPGEDRVVDPERCGDLLAEDAGAAHLDPADPLDIHLGIEARLGIRVVRGLEPHARETHAVVELAEDPEEVAKRDAFIHHDPLELLKLRKVGCVYGLAPVHPAYA